MGHQPTESSKKNITKLETGRKKSKPENKISIKFVQKLDKLGIPENQAADMKGIKIEWNSIFAKNEEDFKILCTDPKCEYRILPSPQCLYDHCIKVHNWGEYKCPRTDNCQFIAYTKEKCSLISRPMNLCHISYVPTYV